MVSMAGIALATTALVVVMSVFNGFHSLIKSRLSALDPPLAAVPIDGRRLSDVKSLCELLDSLPSVAMACPVIEERALAVGNGRQTAVRLRGIPHELYPLFDSICPAGVPWESYHPLAQPAVVSVGVANELLLPIGTEELFGIYVPKRKGRINPANPMAAFRADSLAPSAVFLLNQPELDKDVVYAPIASVARLLQLENAASQINIYPTDNGVDNVRKQASELLEGKARVLTLMEMQAGSFQIVNMEKWMTFMLLGFILVIASFNVVSSLSLLIIEKDGNAGVLSALGATNQAIRRIYLLEGLLITGLGTAIGLLAGTLLSLGQEHFGWVKLAGDAAQLSVTAYPVEFNTIDLLPIALLSLAAGVLASRIATRR